MRELTPPFRWDSYSDQPYPLKDKAYKKKMRIANLWDTLTMVFTNIILFPLSVLLMRFWKGGEVLGGDFIGMGVDRTAGDTQVALINELGIKHLLIRLPLWDMGRIDDTVEFARSFGSDKVILINILQDRGHIEDLLLLAHDIKSIFEKFDGVAHEFQVGNAINRTKWGFFGVGEYLRFYEVVQGVRDRHYPHIKLVGPSVIDFEYHYTIRALFNRTSVRYDKLSALLYVDRRGSPYNTQMGIFDTRRKIDMLYSLAKLSPKLGDEIYITEVNWPLSNTAPYAPTSEFECVSEETYAQYMREYLDIALKSKKITRVYWHRLIAPGYGLVDNRGEKLRKMVAFYELKSIMRGMDS